MPSAPPGFKFGSTCFSVEGIAMLAKETTLIVRYSAADVEAAGGYPSLLTLSCYDEAAGEWLILPTELDTSARTLTAAAGQLSKWMVMAEAHSRLWVRPYVFVPKGGGISRKTGQTWQADEV